MEEVIMPKLGLTMESGIIEKWHKKEGDKVEEGDVLFEVMTDKVSLEVEAYSSGILRKIIKKEEEEVPVTEVVAYIGNKDEEVPTTAVKSDVGDKSPEAKEEKEKVEELSKTNVSEKSGRIKSSPAARRLAKNKGIDISKIKGSGPGGRIVKDDVEKYAESAKESETYQKIKISPLAKKTASELSIDYEKENIKGTGPRGRITKEDIIAYSKAAVPEASAAGKLAIKSQAPLKGMRKTIAQRMSQSKSEMPHLVANIVVDATDLVELREKLKEKLLSMYNIKVTYSDFLLKICAIALRENININSSLQDNNHIVYDDINIGLAISIEEGLIVPTIFKCDKLGIIDIAKKRIDLVEKARSSKLSMNEIADGTFTITNMGMFGIRSFNAIINPPQGAILAVGEMYRAPGVVDGNIEVRTFMELSVSCDHRIIDGAVAAKFMQSIARLIESPELLVV